MGQNYHRRLSPAETLKRNQKIVELHFKGITDENIACQTGLTVSGVRAVLRKQRKSTIAEVPHTTYGPDQYEIEEGQEKLVEQLYGNNAEPIVNRPEDSENR